MKVIALRGSVNTGKSHVINIVYQFLLRDGYVQVPGHFRTLGNLKFEDVIDILTKDGILVGIIGMGDYQRGVNSLANLLRELETKGCHVAICACRDIPAIEAAVTHYPQHVFVNKTPSAGRDNDRIVDGIDAQAIVALI